MHLPQQQAILAPIRLFKPAPIPSALDRLHPNSTQDTPHPTQTVRHLIPKLSITIFTALVSTIAALLCPAKLAWSQSRPAPAAPLLQVEGVLETGDAIISEDNSLYDTYTFEGRAGQAIVIMLESNQFDPYLLLLNEEGESIAQNDDISDGNRNASIAIVLPESGTYRILANAYDSTNRGAYRLTVRPTQPNDLAIREFAAAPETAQIPVEGIINADALVTINGVAWAANDWNFSEVLGIQRDSLDATIVGRVVLDRHGIDTQPVLGIRDPFSGPRPGRFVAVSAWGSNNNGCFAELIFQYATTPDETLDPSLIVPTQLEMVINGQRLTLNSAASSSGANRHFSFQYTYSSLESQNDQLVSVNYPGVGVMARHIFPINAEQARLLRSAPAQDMAVRITLTNRSPITLPIGDGTVERWSSVYGYNPSCS